jgi:hypothetical protein
MADEAFVIAYTEHFEEDGSFVRVDTVAAGDGEIEEKKYVDGIDPEDEDAVAAAKAEKEALQAEVDAINEAAPDEAPLPPGPGETAEPLEIFGVGEDNTNTGGTAVTDTSNQFDIPEPPEKTEQQLHDEAVTAGNAAGPANAGTSTGEWVDAKQEEGELPSDDEANAAREDSPGATGDPADAEAEPANPNVDDAPKRASRAKKTS